MDSTEFLRQMSAQAQHDIKVPKTKLGFIDYDFDTTTYPQVLPKVVIDGEGLSNKGFVCLNTYDPRPGERVVMLPHSDSYVILGSIEKRNPFETYDLYPGQHVLSINNHGASQVWSGSEYIIWTDSDIVNPYGFWSSGDPTNIVPTIPGTYAVYATVAYPTSAIGNRVMQIRQNGSETRSGHTASADMVGTHVRNTNNKTFTFNGTTDSVQIRASLESGSSGSVDYDGAFPSGRWSSQVEMYYVGPPLTKDESQQL